MSAEDDSYWANYDSGPFCRHWSEAGECDRPCVLCQHRCEAHGVGDDKTCMEVNCDCKYYTEADNAD